MFATDKIMNGLSLGSLKGALVATKERPELSELKFRVQNNWGSGAHSVSSIKDFYRDGKADKSRIQSFTMEADQPQTMLAKNQATNPAEIVLYALGSCLNSALAYNSALQGIDIDHIESYLEREIDLQGIFNLPTGERRGYKDITVKFSVKSDAYADLLKQLIELSPMFDMLKNPTPVHIEITKQ